MPGERQETEVSESTVIVCLRVCVSVCVFASVCVCAPHYLEGLDEGPQQDTDGLSLPEQLDETGCPEEPQEAQVYEVVLQQPQYGQSERANERDRREKIQSERRMKESERERETGRERERERAREREREREAHTPSSFHQNRARVCI